MSEGDYFSLFFFGLLKAFLFQREWSCDDKWGLPKLTGNSQVILSAFQRENTTLGVSRDRQNYPLPIYFHSTTHEIFMRYTSQRDWSRSLFVSVFVETKNTIRILDKAFFHYMKSLFCSCLL